MGVSRKSPMLHQRMCLEWTGPCCWTKMASGCSLLRATRSPDSLRRRRPLLKIWDIWQTTTKGERNTDARRGRHVPSERRKRRIQVKSKLLCYCARMQLSNRVSTSLFADESKILDGVLCRTGITMAVVSEHGCVSGSSRRDAVCSSVCMLSRCRCHMHAMVELSALMIFTRLDPVLTRKQ